MINHICELQKRNQMKKMNLTVIRFKKIWRVFFQAKLQFLSLGTSLSADHFLPLMSFPKFAYMICHMFIVISFVHFEEYLDSQLTVIR